MERTLGASRGKDKAHPIEQARLAQAMADNPKMLQDGQLVEAEKRIERFQTALRFPPPPNAQANPRLAQAASKLGMVTTTKISLRECDKSIDSAHEEAFEQLEGVLSSRQHEHAAPQTALQVGSRHHSEHFFDSICGRLLVKNVANALTKAP